MVEELSLSIRAFSSQLLTSTLESIDTEFRKYPDRVKNYYVANTRHRTIITLWGVVSYKRTIYKRRYKKVSGSTYYCHVDKLFGLDKYSKYDPTVKAKMCELYAYSNSMIKVGRILGQQIFCPFSTSKDYTDYAIPRQSVQRSIQYFPKTRITWEEREKTPSNSYIMADEKWVALQNHDSTSDKQRAMVKEAVIFEDIDNEFSTLKRHKLVNKARIIQLDGNIWETVFEHLGELYDLEDIKHIHIMGDGASWIEAGTHEIASPEYTVDFTLDSFHLNQALLRITNDKEKRQKLHDAIYFDQDKKEFLYLTGLLLKEYQDQNKQSAYERAYENMNYVNNHWAAIQRRVSTNTMPCAMEGTNRTL